MIKSVKIYKTSVTLSDLADFVAEADRLGASGDDTVAIRVAPTSNHPTDRGGEITIEISVSDGA